MPRGPLTALSAEERQLTQRKLAIAMYGYSWLKPAGCSKTMLGRREEELEREEIERQMRETEMQERMAAEADEMERQAERNAEGDAAGMNDRDLDDEVPDADGEAEANDDDWRDMVSEAGEGDMGGRDLDDDIPSAADDEASDVFSDDSNPQPQSSPQRDSWTYDTRREPSTPSIDGQDVNADADAALRRIRAQARLQRQAGYQRRPGAPGSDYDVDERDAEAMALADEMLDEDEMGETSFASNRYGVHGESVAERDLDDSVPEADSGEWEHTDSDEELPISSPPRSRRHAQPHQSRTSGFGAQDDEDEEMDISYIPTTAQETAARAAARRSINAQHIARSNSPYAANPGPPAAGRTPRRQGTGVRVVSGNAALISPTVMGTSSHDRRQQSREGSAVSSSVASSGRPSSRQSSGRGGGLTGSTRRGLRSQAQRSSSQVGGSSQMQSFETPTVVPAMLLRRLARFSVKTARSRWEQVWVS
ncbi:uncharacterized protein AB675_3193 [Cyphellophora attinorum]|uniref:Uncharacterized protein n=1 Tax=Cyphellophora attinorum TaxID=1664694 RepID=A0A0N1H6P7_9EURO|nr:uncharacterized protein AB675_3193 [Phialophora attinorum]KPI38005.1 hypothetical protein AB675_3193 [Phialophora attinorum]